MPSLRPRCPAPWALALVLALAVGCGSDDDSEGDSVVDGIDLTGVDVTVGSKNFTEQEILGEITIQVLTAAGATVTDRTGMESTRMARQALIAGATDMYWEYTGTGWTTLLGHTAPVPDPRQQFEAVATEDRRENGIAWVAAAPADNAYAIAVRQEVSDPDSEDYDSDLADVATLTDLADLAGRSPDQATLCVASEFANRPDGLPGLEAAYGFTFPDDNVITLDDEDLIYDAVANGTACTFGEVFRTDSRIDSLDLRLVEDDQDFFAVYNPCLTLRAELLEEHPEIEEMFAPIAADLDDQTLRDLNRAVDVDGEPVHEVVSAYLEDEGFLSPRQLSK